MPFKREREEDEAPVVVRGGAGVEALTGGRNLTIDTLASEMEKMTKKIDHYVKELAEKNKQLEEKDQQAANMAAQIEEKSQQMAEMNTAQQMREVQVNQENQAVKEAWEKERKAAEKYENLEKEHAALKRMFQDQVATIKKLKESSAQSSPEPQAQPQSNKSLNQQLNELRNERNIQGRHLEKAKKRVAELERALGSQTSPTSVPPPCPHNPQDFVTRAFHERVSEAAQQEIKTRSAANKNLQEQVNKLAQELLEEVKEPVRVLQEDKKKLQTQLREKDTEIDRITKKINALEATVDEQSKTIADLEDDNESFAQDLATARAETADRDNQIVEINESYDLDLRRKDQELEVLREERNWLVINTVAQEAYDNVIAEKRSLEAQLAEQTAQQDSGEKDKEINKLQGQVQELKHIVTKTEKTCEEKIAGYESQMQVQQALIQAYETQIKESGRLAKTKLGQLEELQATLAQYEAEARAHVCTPAQEAPAAAPVLSSSNIRCESTAPVSPPLTQAPPAPEPAPTTDYTWWPVEVDDLTAHFKKLSLDTEDEDEIEDEDFVDHHPTVIYRHAPAPAAVAITFNLTTPARPTSALPSTTPPSPPPTPSTTPSSPLSSPPSSPPSPPTSPPSPPTPYDPREDVPDIESWWYDEDQFAETWQGATFEYRRRKPFCKNCRTRRALRLVDGEWKTPADFFRKLPCAEHSKPWYPEGGNPVWQKKCWKEDCADCIESDARVSGEEDQLPEQLKREYACCGPNCTDHSDRLQAKARFVLAENRRFEAEKVAAWWRHHENLEKYRAVYGRRWPASKDD